MTINLTSANVELLKAYRQEAIESLTDAQTAAEHFKEIIETASESTGIAKAEISAYYKAVFGEKVEALLERAELFSLLEGKE